MWLPQGCWRSRYCGGGPPVNCTEFSDVGDILRSSKLRMCALLRVTARADAYAGCSPCKSSICVLQPISLLQQRRVNLSDASDARQTMIREPPLPYLCFLQLGVAGWLAASGQTWPQQKSNNPPLSCLKSSVVELSASLLDISNFSSFGLCDG